MSKRAISWSKGDLALTILTVVIFSLLIVVVVFAPHFLRSSYNSENADTHVEDVVSEPEEPLFVVSHIDTPESVKALYMTACVAGTPSWRDSLKTLIEDTELNAVVIDIKDYTGVLSYGDNITNFTKGCVVSDLKEFIGTLHDSNIYVIGRISVFQDSLYTSVYPDLAVKKVSDGSVWKDFKGLTFVDVGATPYWKYIVDISHKAYDLGFDELNYDYVRYPSDGNMKDANFTWTVGTTTRQVMLESFFKYLHDELQSLGAKLSVDLFGMTTTVTSDLGIGQVLERALPYFDYVAPMVYPSHYPPNWNGFPNPAEYPYEVIKIAMQSAVDREMVWRETNGLATTTPSKLRPWIQDFNLGAQYGPDKVRAQIQATYDLGLSSWMLWNAGNRYTREALLD